MHDHILDVERQLRAALMRIAEMALESFGTEGMDVNEGHFRILVPEVSEALSFTGVLKKLASEMSTMQSYITKN